MKVSDSRNPASEIIQQYKANGTVKSDADRQVNVSPGPEEKVSLSTTARDVQQIKKIIDKLPDVREEKVEALKNQIEKGTYNVSGEKIAEKMIRESLLDIIV